MVRQAFHWHKSDAQRSPWAAAIASKSVRPVILHSSCIYNLVVILWWDQTCAGHMVKKCGLFTVWFIAFHYMHCRIFRNLQVTWEWAVLCILMKSSWGCWDIFCWWQCEDLKGFHITVVQGWLCRVSWTQKVPQGHRFGSLEDFKAEPVQLF